MKFPPIDLSDLDKDVVADVLEQVWLRLYKLNTSGRLTVFSSYVCNNLKGLPDKEGTCECAAEIRDRINAVLNVHPYNKFYGLEDGCDDRHNLHVWVQTHCPEVLTETEGPDLCVGREMLAYRLAWVKHMMEQVQ